MAKIGDMWRTTKIAFGVVSALVMLSFIAYSLISQNHRDYDIGSFLGYVVIAAVLSIIAVLLIVVLIYKFCDRSRFLAHLDKAGTYISYVLGVSVAFILFSAIWVALGGKNSSWVELNGCLLVWGFFLNLYFIIAYRVINKLRR